MNATHLHLTKFLKLLKVELEDLIGHLELLVTRNRERRERGEEPDHVCFENIALLENEEFGVRDFIRILDNIDVTGYESTDAVVAYVRERFRGKVSASGLAPAVLLAAERRIEKVIGYMQLGKEAETD